MNERINELAIQAGGIWRGGFVDQNDGSSVYVHKKFVDGGDMDVEQFARLVVQECCSIVEGFEITQEVALDEYEDFEASSVLKDCFGISND